ncbi:MAG TPA: hypothetical protein VIL37_13060 [Natronosporangium sp.]
MSGRATVPAPPPSPISPAASPISPAASPTARPATPTARPASPIARPASPIARPASQPAPGGTLYQGSLDGNPIIDRRFDPPSDGTGSLTGFILSRGRAEADADTGMPTSRLIVIALVVLLMIGLLTAIGLVAVNTALDGLLGG